jgi:hypothetical protein|tara:strand:+ start:29 stop:496 length:468 start_codon:yes stop_codon:yes gene_type:complete
MAAFKIKDTLVSMQSILRQQGNVYDAVIGEPKKPFTPKGQTRRVAAAIWMTDWAPTLTLATSVEVFTAMVRLHVDAFSENVEETELALADAFNEFTTGAQQGYTLGSTIRNIDVAGEMSAGMSGAWGHVTYSDTTYRIVDIVVPLIVNDVATHAA